MSLPGSPDGLNSLGNNLFTILPNVVVERLLVKYFLSLSYYN